MHGNRRRKKRPSYGVRTVEITKGHVGYGFTISGQEPCILSCIVPGSPAEKAGLRPGDYLIAVNGQNVSKAPHDYVVRLIGLSKLLKLQIAENYYSDSSDDEFTVNRPKPKYPNRLRHKHQQTRAEKVVRDLQSGAIFSEHAALHHSENAPLSDRDWTDTYPPKEPYTSTSVPNTINSSTGHPPTPSTSPTRLRPDQIRLVMAEARQAARIPRPNREEAPMHPPRMRPTPKKKEILHKNILQNHVQHQQVPEPHAQDMISVPLKQDPFALHHLHTNRQHQHTFQNMRNLQQISTPSRQYQEHPNQGTLQYQPQSVHIQHPENVQLLKSYPLQPLSHLAQQLRQKQLNQHISKQIQLNQLQSSSQSQPYKPANDSCNLITEQDINNLLYPTLAELHQQVQPEEMGDAVYRAVVGYLGTIEMPKEPQGGSRLTAIRNCIRRLRIEKKVHTLVLMTIFPEQVVLTNPHGLTLAEYPAERITFCGVYADDKKFFGLVTVHGTSSDELSDGSQEEAGELTGAISSSCHVFMVDVNTVQHSDHAKRAKNFRLECTQAPDDVTAHCLEFPDSADPVLHAIMSLYRNRMGFHLYTRAPGLIDIDAQMSPQHSNTSSNSSNSDSGIGFRDEGGGGHHYHHNDRVFVVEFDDNNRTQLQNIQLVANLRDNGGNICRSNIEYLRANIDNLRANMNVSLANNINVIASEASDSSLTPVHSRGSLGNKNRKQTNNINDNANNNVPSCSKNMNVNGNNLNLNSVMNCASIRSISNENARNDNNSKLMEKMQSNYNCDMRGNVTDNEKTEYENNLRVSVSDMKKLKELRNSLAEGRLSLTDGRTSMTDDLRASTLLEKSCVDGRNSITKELNDVTDRSANRTPARDCVSPEEGNRLTVRAMPDPISFERSPGYYVGAEPPAHVASIRHSMHKYLQHKQEHLVKESQKINRRESDSGGTHPLSVRAFSPSTAKHASSTPIPKNGGPPTSAAMELSLKLSPKVYGLPFRPSAPSERSFTRSLEDLRDSSTSDGICGHVGVYPVAAGSYISGGNGSSFRDGSESDHGLDRLRSVVPLGRLLHASETNLSRCGPSSAASYAHEIPSRGAFRAVAPRSHRNNVAVDSLSVRVVPRVGRLSDIEVDTIRGIPYLSDIGGLRPTLDSCDENTETTENTGGQGGSQDVHPPTQDEFSHDSDSEQVDGTDTKKARGVSLRRFGRSRHHSEIPPPNTSDSNATHSDTEVGKITIHSRGVNNDTPLQDQDLTLSSGASSWAVSFEKLLEDPAGLHTFAEFLKKEYSHENIYFWTACERYKLIVDDEDKLKAVREIFNRHLGEGASEPVNVDAHARQMAQNGIANPDKYVFSAAQKQIFNLMKFDSYTRFLKSDLYNNCLSQERRGFALPYPGDDSLDPDLRIGADDPFSKHLKKSKSDAEDRRRKSLLPWNRKDRSKSKDRGETEYRRRKKLGHRPPSSDTSSAKSDLTDSHTSLNSSDFVPGRRAMSKESLSSAEVVSLSGSECFNLCRVNLPDRSNSVLAVRSGETVNELIRPLLDKRRINFSTFNVILIKGDKVVDLNSDSTVLGGYEVRIDRMVLFSLHLPSRKTVYVKAKPHKLICEILHPILHKYGYKLDHMALIRFSDSKIVNTKSQVTELDGEKFIVHTKDEVKAELSLLDRNKDNSSLEEITNRVFDDVLNGKTRPSFDDLGVLDFDTKNEMASGASDSSSDNHGSLKRGPMTRDAECSLRQLAPPSNKPRPNAKPETELFEDLIRVQNRIDDQRGTEINFELPEFLKCEQNMGQENRRQLADELLVRFDRSFKSDSKEFFSRAHPEVWGDMKDRFSPAPSKGGSSSPFSPLGGSADATLLAPPELDLDDLEETLRAPGDGISASAETEMELKMALNGTDASADLSTNNNNNNNPRIRGNPYGSPFCTQERNRLTPSPAAFLSPPPPPLPPKPKLGGLARGPPPRPPSRQLPSLSHSLHQLMDDSIHLLEPPIRLPQTPMDKCSVSFV